MDAANERAALALLRELADLAPEARTALLTERSRDNPALAARVQMLLAQFEEEDTQPIVEEDLVAGIAIGPYRVLRRIGRGGMGEVFLAERADGAFERQVALKRIWGGAPQLTDRFLRERGILARLVHPNIAQLYDGGVTAQGHPWFAMEHIHGETITRWCDARRLSLEARVELLAKVCEAVQFAHHNLIVHRDLKPANVLVSADGVPKLLDFGIAKLLDDVDPNATQTLAMTPAWAAPEQRSGGAITTATDVWQLGMLLRALLIGDSRHEGDARLATGFAALLRDDSAAAQALANARATTPERLCLQLKGDLEHIVALATADDPRRRYANPQALADDLRRWQQRLPVQARRDERGYRLRRSLRHYWPAVAATIASLAFLGFHIYSMNAALQRTEQQRRQAVAAERRAKAERLRAEHERDKAALISDYFSSLFDEDLARGVTEGEVSARELLDVSITKVINDKAMPDSLKGVMLTAAGRAQLQLGEQKASLATFTRAITALQSLPADEAGDLVDATLGMSSAQYQSGNAEEAYRSVQKAATVFSKVKHPSPELEPSLLNLQGILANTLGKDFDSLAAFKRAAALTEPRLPSRVACSSYISALINQGQFSNRKNDPVDAEKALRRALAAADRCQISKELALIARQYLGMAMDAQGRFDEAAKLYDQLEADARAYYKPDDLWLAGVLVSRAVNDMTAGRDAEARRRIEEADAIYGAVMPSDAPMRVSTRTFRAFLNLTPGRTHLAIREVNWLEDFYAARRKSPSPIWAVARLQAQCIEHPSAAVLSQLRQTIPPPEHEDGRGWKASLMARWEQDCTTRTNG